MDFQVYKLSECGFYDKKNDNAFCFGGINHWWTDFSSWAQARPFNETKTYRNDKDCTPSVYCSTVGEFKEEEKTYYYVSLWNETTSRDGKVQSMASNAIVNQVQVLDNKIEEGSIPGWASNFIYDTENGYIISFTPDNGFSGRALGFHQLETYFINYLRFFSNYCVFKTNKKDLTKNICGYRTTEDKEPNLYSIKLKTQRIILPAFSSFIKDNIAEINKVVYRSKMNFKSETEYVFISKLLTDIGIPIGINITPSGKTYTFSSEIPWFPSEEDLDMAIREWGNENSLQEAGVKFSYDNQKVHWFNRALAKDSKILDVELERKTVLNNNDFLTIWNECKNNIHAKYPQKETK